jgi:hypothetical protein
MDWSCRLLIVVGAAPQSSVKFCTVHWEEKNTDQEVVWTKDPYKRVILTAAKLTNKLVSVSLIDTLSEFWWVHLFFCFFLTTPPSTKCISYDFFQMKFILNFLQLILTKSSSIFHFVSHFKHSPYSPILCHIMMLIPKYLKFPITIKLSTFKWCLIASCFDNPLSQIAVMLEFKLFFSAHLGRGWTTPKMVW